MDIMVASLLRQIGKRNEALKAYELALAHHEGLPHITAIDRYNIACAHACLASLLSEEPAAGPQARRAKLQRHLDSAMQALRETVAAGHRDYAEMAADSDLTPLRSRTDFQQLIMDPIFPDDPFAK
jgi:hypothetical protein